MSEQMLKTYLTQLFAAKETGEVTVSWQGGEPTLMGLAYFQKAAAYSKQLKKPGQRIVYTLQTNGTLLDDEWCAFLKKHNFLVGLSIDGPGEMHDNYRVDTAGNGSFDRVMKGWECLKKHNVDVNILCTVHAANAKHPLEVYRFFRDTLGARFIQFIPIVERGDKENTAAVTDRSVGGKQFGRFLIGIFEEWIRRDVGQVFIQSFDTALGNRMGQHTLCVHSPTCGGSLALEHNGDVYSCDHFVDPAYYLGNISDTDMSDMVMSQRQRQFGQDKLDTLPQYCRSCDVNHFCFGGCPKDRFIKTPAGESGLNYLCEGYKIFFRHIAGPVQKMMELIYKGQTPGDIMQR